MAFALFIENYRPGVMDRLGLGYDEILKIKPDIVYACQYFHLRNI